jgi:formate/nitrite transporter FocA (FNT family)
MSRAKKPGSQDKASSEIADGKNDAKVELSGKEVDDVEENLPPRAQVLHETIRVQGEAELSRTVAALGWSALAAGLSMGLSMLARALLHAHLPDEPWRFLIENLGYTVGFLVVILARQQLFTENTMTAVLPLMSNPGFRSFYRLLRLWSVVLFGNLVGVALFAYGLGHAQVLDAEVRDVVIELGQSIMMNSGLQMFTKGIVAGWLIATMVWLIPAAQASKILVIVLMTYLIGIGEFTHIIVGSTEVLFLVFDGRLSFADYVLAFGLPTLAGNVVGGSLIFALISQAQISSE